MKICTSNKNLSEDKFWKNKKLEDGLQDQCKDCKKKYKKEHDLKIN